MEQKRIKRDESEFVYVKGGFPQIISEEQYERCMEAIEAALCEAVEMHDGLVSEDFIDLFVSQVTPLSDSRFAWCLDFSPQPTVAFLNLAGQRKYTTCSMDSKLHFGPFADEEGHTIPFPGSLRR